MSIETFTLEKAEKRADKTVADLLEVSRKRSRELIDENRVTVNGQPVKPSTSLSEGTVLSIDVPEEKELEIAPENIPLDIVYEDEDIIIINKPKGMVVHPAPGNYEHTLVNALLYHVKDLSGINGVMRPGIVHRIDKDTSGLIAVAKNDKAHNALAAQLADKTMNRHYKAIVHKPFPNSYGTIKAPIGRDEKDRQSMTVTAKNSKEAVTHFEVLENFKNYAYIKCRLETGRTHQIRVHMKYIGHPVAGDPKYGPRKTLTDKGQLLHAYRLELVHPTTGEKMAFEAPLDPEFAHILDQLEKGEIE